MITVYIIYVQYDVKYSRLASRVYNFNELALAGCWMVMMEMYLARCSGGGGGGAAGGAAGGSSRTV